MRNLILLAFVLVALVVVFGPPVQATHAAPVLGFVYTNNDDFSGNSVSEFKVNSDGTLTFVKSFSTGGTGCGGGFWSSDRIKVSNQNDMLFAANDCSHDIAVFTGASTGNLVLQGNVSIEGYDVSLLTPFGCVAAGFRGTGDLISYKILNSSPWLQQVSKVSTGGSISALNATFVGSAGYVVGVQPGQHRYAVLQTNPNDCSMSNVTYIASGVTTKALPMSVSFLTFGSSVAMYGAIANPNGVELDYCPGFPMGTCTASFYQGMAAMSATLLTGNLTIGGQKTSCAFLGLESASGVASIQLDPNNGQPGTKSTPYALGSGLYTGTLTWHNSMKGFFIPTTNGSSNNVWTEMVGAGCALTSKGPAATDVTDGSYLLSLTAYPQVGH